MVSWVLPTVTALSTRMTLISPPGERVVSGAAAARAPVQSGAMPELLPAPIVTMTSLAWIELPMMRPITGGP